MWYVWAASVVRSGHHLGIGQVNTKWLPKEDIDKILRIGEIELELEILRREISPNSASRLGCLWVAEDSPEGGANIRDMLGPSLYLAKVRIPVANQVSKVDRKWYDLYCAERRVDFGRNYWDGIPFGSTNYWEYLVDGVIESATPSDLEYIRTHGARAF